MEKTITATNGKKERAKPVPQKYEAIEAGALKLPLDQKVNLKNKLNAAITVEFNERKAEFEKAEKLINGE